MAILSNNHPSRKGTDAAYYAALERIRESALTRHAIPPAPEQPREFDPYEQLDAGEALHRLMDRLGEAEVLRLAKLCAIGRGAKAS